MGMDAGAPARSGGPGATRAAAWYRGHSWRRQRGVRRFAASGAPFSASRSAARVGWSLEVRVHAHRLVTVRHASVVVKTNL